MVLTLFIVALMIGVVCLVSNFITKEVKDIKQSETDVDVLLEKRKQANKLNEDVDASVEKVKQKISKIENTKHEN